MAKKLFTDLSIKKLKPHSTKRLELPDAGAPGLYVCVQPSGAKSFAMRFRRPDGRNARLVLGGFDPTPRDPHAKPEIGASLTITLMSAGPILPTGLSAQRSHREFGMMVGSAWPSR